MSETKEQPISAVKGTGADQQKREFTPTQWASMGKDKAGWKAATPKEALLSNNKTDAAPGADAALLNARERYATLFEKQPAANATVDQLEKKIAAELEKQNAGGDQGKGKASGTAKAKTAAAPQKPTEPTVATGALPPADANVGGDTGGDADANKGAADADKGPDAATSQN